MELLAPAGLAAMAALPALVLLYFLRRKQKPKVVGSLMLWAASRREIFRGRPWERFRPSALMWIQLLVAAGLALALARPACVLSGLQSRQITLVFDASASMGSRDGDPSRFADAISEGLRIVETAPPGSEIAILTAGRITRVAQPFTRDRDAAKAELHRLLLGGPEATSGSVHDALLLALQLSTSDDNEIVVISDGAFLHEQLPPLSGNIRFVNVGHGSANLAITMFELRRRASQRFGTTAFCRVVNTGDVALESHLRFELEGTLLEAHTVALGPGEEKTFSVPLSTDTGRVVARLLETRAASGQDKDAEDLLAADDQAHAVISEERPLAVVAVGANPLLQRALQANPRLDVDFIAPEEYSGSSSHDVTVFDGFFPSTIPQGRWLVFAPVHENPVLDYSGELLEGTAVGTWDQGHPVLYHVDFTGVRFGTVRQSRPHDALVAIAELKGVDGPLVLAGRTPSWRGVVFAADLMETDFPLKVSFPVFLYNAVGWLSPGGEEGSQGRSLKTGQALPIAARPGDALVVTWPSGEVDEREVSSTKSDGVLLYERTEQTGFYEVEVTPRGGTTETATYGVSLCDVAESRIEPKKRLALPRGAEIIGTSATEHVVERADETVLVVFGLVVVEWLVYLAWARRRRRKGVRRWT